MIFSRSLARGLVLIIATALLACCGAPTAAPTATHPLPPPPPIQPPPLKSPIQPPKPQDTPKPQPTVEKTASSAPADLFKFIRTVAVTPDDEFLAGGFIRFGYVPARNQIVTLFGSPKLAKPSGKCTTGGKAYKVYTVDMQPTGESGVLHCEGGGDTADLFVDNVFYDVVMIPVENKEGWLIKKFDAVTWKELGRLSYGLDSPREMSGDMSIEYLNGQLDISGAYLSNGKLHPAEEIGGATNHNFFSMDLKFLEKRTLSDSGHIVGSSAIYVDGVYYFISSNAYAGDVILMKYDQGWKFLGTQTLIEEAHWPEGLAFDGQRFYLSYLDTSLRTKPGFFPYYPNVHLAAFDRDWNLLEDVALTNYTAADNVTTGRPWLILHGKRLYVGYDAAQRDEKGNDNLETIEVYVSMYDITQ